MGQQVFAPYGTQDTASDPRKAALLLHAMSPDDQQWILAQLLPAQRATLLALLLEIKELGIPADQAFLSQVISTASHPARSPDNTAIDASEPGPEAPLAMLEQAYPVMLGEILRDESAGLIARVLALQAWPWSDALLEQLNPVKRRRVEELLVRYRQRQAHPTAEVGEALSTQLLVQLQRRLDEFRIQWAVDQVIPHQADTSSVHVLQRCWRQFVYTCGRFTRFEG